MLRECKITEVRQPEQAYEDRVLLVLTLIIGAIVGLVVVAFIVVTERLGSRLYPPGGAAWRRVLIPLVGSLVSGFLMFRYFPGARGSGIPQTKIALFLHDGYISLRTVLGKFGLCSFSLASGIALGREGPSVQVGAGLASVLGRRLGLGPSSVRALLPVGASAALAAAFNTPIAAVLFSLEEVMGDMHAPVLGSIVLSSATSWIVLHLLLGDEPLFHVPSYQLVHPLEFAIYALLGVAGGLVSVAFVKLLLLATTQKHFLAAPCLLTSQTLAATGGRRPHRRHPRLVLPCRARRWLWLRRTGAQRPDADRRDGTPRCAQDRRHVGLLFLRQRRRHLRSQPFHRRHDGRRRGRRGPPTAPRLYRQRRRLRAGRHGHRLCRYPCASPSPASS